MESIRKNYLLEKYKDVVGEDIEAFDKALDEASNQSFPRILDIDTQFKGKPLTKHRKEINKNMLFAATKSEPDEDAEVPQNYHNDIYKTICFYDKYKTEISKPNAEKFKSAVYYVPDEAFDEVEKLELKDKKKMMKLSTFGGLIGLGSFYLGNTKRGVMQIVINVLLIAAIVLIAMMNVLVLTVAVTLGVLIGLAFRWGAEIDVCNYAINVINGQKILDALTAYRADGKSE